MIKGQFAVIPVKVLKDSRLSDKQLRLLCVLAAYTNSNDGYCYPSMSRLADDCGCDRRSIIRNMNELVALGYVKKEGTYNEKTNGQTVNLYYLHYDIEPAEKPEAEPAEIIPLIHNPSDTSVTPPSDISVTPPVTSVSPLEQYKENKTPLSKIMNKRAGAHLKIENEKKEVLAVTDEDKKKFNTWFEELAEEMGKDKAEQAVGALDIYKRKEKIELVVGTEFLQRYLTNIGFFTAFEKIANENFKLGNGHAVGGIAIKDAIFERA